MEENDKQQIMQMALESAQFGEVLKYQGTPALALGKKKDFYEFKFSPEEAASIASQRGDEFGCHFDSGQVQQKIKMGTFVKSTISNRNDPHRAATIDIQLYPYNGILDVNNRRISADDEALRYLIIKGHLKKYGEKYKQAYIGHYYYLYDKDVKFLGPQERLKTVLDERMKTLYKVLKDLKMEN